MMPTSTLPITVASQMFMVADVLWQQFWLSEDESSCDEVKAVYD